MLDRIQECEENGPGCDFPLSWSISPHLLYLAPDWLHWYYQLANQTGHDVFVLPPSGHLYAYPGKLLKFKAKPSAKIFKFLNQCFARLRCWKKCLKFTKPICWINSCFAGDSFLRPKSFKTLI